MKKILIFAIAAIFCFCSCIERVEDYIYSIAIASETSSSITTGHDPEGNALIKEFMDAVDAFKSKNSGNWQWVETINGGNTSKADAAAKKTYDKYNAELKSIIDTYQAKFDALTGNGSLYEGSREIILYRSMSGNEILASTKYNISYGK